MFLFIHGLAKDNSAVDFPAFEDDTYGGLFAKATYVTMDKAKDSIRKAVADLCAQFATDVWRFSLGSHNSFRKDLSERYKAHRKPLPSQVLYLKAWFVSEYSEYMIPVIDGMEADDVLGIAHTVDSTKTIIVSGDKDMLQVPGWNYNPRTRELRQLTTPMADSFLLYQTLVGDSADGYPGCPGIGDAKAHALLLRAWEVLGHDMQSLWDVVKFTYLSQGSTEEDFIMNAKLAHIYRAGDMDYQRGNPWTPPNAMKDLKPSYRKLLKEIITNA